MAENAAELDDELASVVVDDAWAPGTVVLARGIDAEGANAVAIWHLSPLAHPVGAWVLSNDSLDADVAVARRMLVLVERRAITANDLDMVSDVLSRASRAAGVSTSPWWEAQTFAAMDALRETVRRRAELEHAVVDEGYQRGKKYAPLEWRRELPTNDLPHSANGIRAFSSIASAPGAPVVSEALTLSRILRWLVQGWIQTEQPKNRRRYLAERLGAPQPLPPSWMSAVTTAARTRLPL